jgi:hypothetical protein
MACEKDPLALRDALHVLEIGVGLRFLRFSERAQASNFVRHFRCDSPTPEGLWFPAAPKQDGGATRIVENYHLNRLACAASRCRLR